MAWSLGGNSCTGCAELLAPSVNGVGVNVARSQGAMLGCCRDLRHVAEETPQLPRPPMRGLGESLYLYLNISHLYCFVSVCYI